MSVHSGSSSIFLPDGTEIPLQRNDLSKLTKITRSSRSGTLTSSEGSRELKGSVQASSEKTASGSGSRHSKEEKGKGRQAEDLPVSKSTASGLVSTEMERSGQSLQTPTIAGHLLAPGPGVVQRKDGTSRPIYSPTPEKLKERKNQVASGSNHPRTPLGEEAALPATPLLSTLRRFSKSNPSLATPENSRPGTGVDPPQEEAQRKSNDDLLLNSASRKTFGPQSTLFEEASKMLESEREKRQSKESSNSDPPQIQGRSRSDSLQKSLNRNSFSSDTTALDSPALGATPLMLDRSNSGKRRSFSLDGDRISFGDGRERIVSGMVAPPSDVIEAKEPASDGEASQASDDTQFELEEAAQLIKDDWTKRKPQVQEDSEDDDQESKSRVIQIIDTRDQFAHRPGTAQTRFSTKSAESQLRHGRRAFSGPNHSNNVACRQCFRAGFDCAMNLQLGEGTAGRKAFQEFVASGGLQALSVQDSPPRPASRGRSRGFRPGTGNLSIGEALGDNYVDKLGEVKFGESALSRPVTRGMVDQMLEDRGKELADQLKRITVEDFREQLHRGAVGSYGGEDEDYDDFEEDTQLDLDFTEIYPQSQARNIQDKRRRSSLRTPPRGITPTPDLEQSLEEGEIPQLRHLRDRVLANQDDAATTAFSQDEELDFLPDRWSSTRKVLQIGVCLLYIFSIEVVDSGYVSRNYSFLQTLSFSLLSNLPSLPLLRQVLVLRF